MNRLRSTVSAGAVLVSISTLISAAGVASAQSTEASDTIVVRGVFVPDEKQDTAEISSLLDADDFTRAGDSDVASAIRRVAGLSVVDGKFPVARGLNERYQSATVNGVPLPSPEPLRRAVPLDIIPTKILAGSLTQKTYSPELSGEFGGAAIDLRTAAIPTSNFLQVSGSTSYDTVTTGEAGFFYEGSDRDRFGYDDGLRDLPGIVDQEVLAGADLLSGPAAASLDNTNTVLIVRDDVPWNGNGSFVGGLLLKDTPDLRIGTVGYVGFNRVFTNRDGVQDRTRLQAGAFSAEEVRLEYLETREDTQLSALSSTGVEIGSDHELQFTGFLLRSSLKRARVGTAVDDAEIEGRELNQEFTEFVERQVWQTQLSGEHLFPNLSDAEVSWRLAYGEADRDSPYERTTLRSRPIDTDEAFRWDPLGRRQQLRFSDLEDQNFYAGADYKMPLELGGFPTEVKAGFAYTDNSRDTQVRRFSILVGEGFTTSDLGDLTLLRTDLLYSDEIFEAGLLQIGSDINANFPDTTEASLEVLAGYASADIELSEHLRLSIGGRFEDSTQETATFLSEDGSPTPDQVVELQDSFFLPAATVTWNPVGNLQLRAGASKTITRPQFRELAFTEFLDPDLDIPLQGNPFLINSEIINVDLRAEWYFSRGEFVTLGLFYKDIDNPIERVLTTRESAVTTFVNNDSAEIFGFEGEFEKRLDLSSVDYPWIKDQELVFIANYTYTDSEVSVEEGVVTAGTNAGNLVPLTDVTLDPVDGHSLQGQSDHLANLQIGFENANTGDQITAVLNYASDRTLLIGTQLQEDSDRVIEDVPVLLDLIYRKKLEAYGANFTFGAQVQNILGQEFRAYREDNQGAELPFLGFDRGRVFSLSLTVNY